MKYTSKLQKLKEYFKKRDDVIMVFVFGSRAKGYARENSDWDIAVYFKPEVKSVEWEEHNREYPEENKVWGDCIKILQTDDVDLVVLNRVPSTTADAAIQGIPLVIKDKKVFLEFMLNVTREGKDFRKTAEEYAEIYWQSASLTEEATYSLNRRLIFLDSELSALSHYKLMTFDDYEHDGNKRRQVERCIENLMNAAIDVSKIILGSEKKTIPSTYREMLHSVGYVNHFSKEVADKLSSWADLRNILAHEYLDITWKSIHNFLKNAEPFFRQFIESAKKLLKANQK